MMSRTPQHSIMLLHDHTEVPVMFSGAGDGLCPDRSVLIEPTMRNEPTHKVQASRRKSLRQSPTMMSRTPQLFIVLLHDLTEALVMFWGARDLAYLQSSQQPGHNATTPACTIIKRTQASVSNRHALHVVLPS